MSEDDNIYLAPESLVVVVVVVIVVVVIAWLAWAIVLLHDGLAVQRLAGTKPVSL